MTTVEISDGIQVNYPPIGDCKVLEIGGYYYLEPITEDGWGNSYQRYKYGNGQVYGKRCGRVMPLITNSIATELSLLPKQSINENRSPKKEQ